MTSFKLLHGKFAFDIPSFLLLCRTEFTRALYKGSKAQDKLLVGRLLTFSSNRRMEFTTSTHD